jgi:NodT family efflux transporter outer membrane factor (OMF) lipoprotein
VIVALSACSQVPVYERPVVPALAVWSTGPSAARADVGASWWREFRSAELTSLEIAALGENFDLQSAVARIQQARSTATIASATLFPSLDLSGTLARSTGFSTNSTQDVLALASYEVDFWGKNRATADAAGSLVDAAASDADTVAITLAATVANTYFQILSLKERIDQASRIARDARRILSLVELQKSGGTAAELLVQQQRNAAATFAAAVPVLQLQLDQSEHLLAVLVGVPPGSLRVVARGLGGIMLPLPRGGLPSSLLERRPDIRSAEARLIAANFNIGAARAAFLPSLTLNGSAGLSALTLSKTSPTTLITDAAAGVVQPIFDGGRLQGQLALDQARAAELAATYRQIALNSFQDVEDSLSAERRIRALAGSNLEAVTSARRAQALAEEQYKLGGSDYLTVLNTQRTLFQAEDSYLQVRLQRLQAAVSLFRSLGGGFSDAPGAI